MSPADFHSLPAPHFRAGQSTGQTGGPGHFAHESTPAGSAEIGGLMMRGSDCLVASLQACTAEAGLNEARFRVLASLAESAAAECSQAELAVRLLQSESNLSTLLERMSGDGLIVRRRSETDRRRSLIRLTSVGVQALNRAKHLRSVVLARLMRDLPPDVATRLLESLSRVVGGLERSLDVGVRRASGLDPAFGAVPVRTVAGSG